MHFHRHFSKLALILLISSFFTLNVTAQNWLPFGTGAYSYLWITQSEVNLQVCGERVPTAPLYVIMERGQYQQFAPAVFQFSVQPDGSFSTQFIEGGVEQGSISGVRVVRDGTCTHIYNMEGPGDVFNIRYYTRAALDAQPDRSWPVPCYFAVGGIGLCDSIQISGGGGGGVPIIGNQPPDTPPSPTDLVVDNLRYPRQIELGQFASVTFDVSNPNSQTVAYTPRMLVTTNLPQEFMSFPYANFSRYRVDVPLQPDGRNTEYANANLYYRWIDPESAGLGLCTRPLLNTLQDEVEGYMLGQGIGYELTPLYSLVLNIITTGADVLEYVQALGAIRTDANFTLIPRARYSIGSENRLTSGDAGVINVRVPFWKINDYRAGMILLVASEPLITLALEIPIELWIPKAFAAEAAAYSIIFGCGFVASAYDVPMGGTVSASASLNQQSVGLSLPTLQQTTSEDTILTPYYERMYQEFAILVNTALQRNQYVSQNASQATIINSAEAVCLAADNANSQIDRYEEAVITANLPFDTEFLFDFADNMRAYVNAQIENQIEILSGIGLSSPCSVGTPPEVTQMPDQISFEGERIHLQIEATDDDAVLRYVDTTDILETLGLNLNAVTGQITGRIARGTAGTYQVTIDVIDRDGAVGSTTFNWTVTDTPVYQPLTVCWVQHWNGQGSTEWRITNENPVPLSSDPDARLRYNWTTYDAEGNELQSVRGWDSPNPNPLNINYSHQITVEWFIVVDGQPSEILGSATAMANSQDRCDESGVEPTEETTAEPEAEFRPPVTTMPIVTVTPTVVITEPTETLPTEEVTATEELESNVGNEE